MKQSKETNPIQAVATVECRSESRGEEQPVAINMGGTRFEITDVIDRAMITNVEAGQPIRHRLWVELEDGSRCQLIRVLPDGPWRVWVDGGSS